jgi:drug/metabolite transporter (DMT)-like permease
MNGTIIGMLAPIIWGMSLPIVRIFEEQIGIPATIGSVFAGAGILGLLNHAMRRDKFPDKKIFRNPLFYGRWVFFVLHEALNLSAIMLVKKENVPVVILINYLWPTAVILCSVFLAGVKISRWWAFIFGSVVIIMSLSIEVLGTHGISFELFDRTTDCLAYMMSFVGAISWGLYCAISKRAGAVTGGSSVIPFFQLTLGLALPLSFLPGNASWGGATYYWTLYLGCFCVAQFVAYLSWDYGMRLGNIVVLSLCADFIPWLSFVTCYLFLNVKIEGKTIIAVILLVLGAMITRYGTLQKRMGASQIIRNAGID